MRLTPIIEHLAAAGLKRVEGALELAALAREPGQLPATYVVPMSEDAVANRTTGVHDQAASWTFGVVLLLDASRSAGRDADALDKLIETAIGALVGWRHPEASRPCDYASGRMLSVSGSTVAWLATFRTGRHIRKVV